MKKLALIIAFLTLPLAAQAQEAFYLSGLLGLTDLQPSSGSAEYDYELTYGLRGGLLFNEHMSAGIFLQQLSTDQTNAVGYSAETSAVNVLAEFTYYFTPADEDTFWVSGLLGTTFVETEFNDGTKVTDDGTTLGVAAGYHFMVAPNFSISPQVTYLHVGTNPELAEISGMVNLTLWL